MVALRSSFDVKGALLAPMYFFFYRDMAIKYIKNSAFVHTKIVYVRSSCNYIISELGIIEVFIISVGIYLWF